MKTLAQLLPENIITATVTGHAYTGYSDTTFNIVSYQGLGGIGARAYLDDSGNNNGVSAGDTYDNTVNGLIGTDSSSGDGLYGNSAGNILRGLGGDDTLSGLSKLSDHIGADTFDGGSGTDTVTYKFSQVGVTAVLGSAHYGYANAGGAEGDVYTSIENLTGSSHDDILVGDDGNNVLSGGLGSDILIGGLGADKFFGEASGVTNNPGDIDTVTYEHAGSAIAFEVGYGFTSVGEAQGDTFTGIEKFIGSAFNDTMGGSDAAESFEGGAGNDVLAGYAGADTLNGGDGIDTANYYLHTNTGVQVNLATGTGSGGFAQGDVLISIENVIGTNQADTIIGSDADNVIDGRDGADIMSGGKGNDTFYVDNIGDVVIENPGEGTDLVMTKISYALGANVENLTAVAGSGSLSLTGNNLNNVITGSDGNDTITGGGGVDTLSGGAGNDTYIIDNVNDVINDVSGTNVVYSTVSYDVSKLPVGTKAFLLGNDAINLTGTAKADTLVGNAGSNKIYGKGGVDVVTGGGGADRFIFDVAPKKKLNIEKITDFSHTQHDAFWLKHTAFKAFGKKGSETKPVKIKADTFFVGSAAHDSNDHIIYDKNKGILYYDADGIGGQAQVEFATVKAKTKLYYSDFFTV